MKVRVAKAGNSSMPEEGSILPKTQPIPPPLKSLYFLEGSSNEWSITLLVKLLQSITKTRNLTYRLTILNDYKRGQFWLSTKWESIDISWKDNGIIYSFQCITILLLSINLKARCHCAIYISRRYFNLWDWKRNREKLTRLGRKFETRLSGVT